MKYAIFCILFLIFGFVAAATYHNYTHIFDGSFKMIAVSP